MALEITSKSCTEEAKMFINIYTLLLYAPLAFIYSVVAVVFIRHPSSFHPLFVISFFLILLAYTTSNLILFFGNFLEFFYYNEIVFSILGMILLSANYYIQPIVILACLERVAATVFVSKYEKSLQWFPYLIGQIICVSLVYLMNTFKHHENVLNNIQLLLSLVNCFCLIILFLVNWQKTANSVAKSVLTIRYQLTENVKALKIFLPFIVLDNVVSLMFVLTGYTISIGRTFDEEQCRKSSSYIPVFIIFRTIAVVIQISMAFTVVYMHESVKLWGLKNWLRNNRSQNALVTMTTQNHLKVSDSVKSVRKSPNTKIEAGFSNIKDCFVFYN